MSIKRFCDKCKTEITDNNNCSGGKVSESRLGTSIKTKEGTLSVELLHSWNGTANAGDFCKYCIIDAFISLDDRPRSA